MKVEKGKVLDLRSGHQRKGLEVRKFRPLGDGRYRMEGLLEEVEAGDEVWVTVKEQEAALFLKVERVKKKLIPIGATSLEVSGPELSRSRVHRWDVACDRCQAQKRLSFISENEGMAKSNLVLANAYAEIEGWAELQGGKHICDRCLGQVESA